MVAGADRWRAGTRSSTIAIGLVLLLGFLAAELFFRGFEPFWDRLAPQRFAKMELHRAALASGRTYDRVFIGSSTTFMGIDPAIVDRHAGGISFNAGQLSYTAIDLNLALAREVIDAKLAREIVFSMDSWVATLPASDRAMIDRHGRSDHFLWLSSIFRNRPVFIFWLGRLARGEFIRPGDAWRRHLETSRRFLSWDRVDLRPDGYLETFALMDPDWPDYARPKEIDPPTAEGITRLVRMCAEAGVRLTIVRPPEYDRTFRENRATHEAISAFLRDLAARERIGLIDFFAEPLFTGADASRFMDIHHVNAEGAKVLSAALGIRLRDRRQP